ncbi:hypothetical protein EES44_17040 [Streptomyces sp. ADI96-15]|nr:hypothetical protein EES44_17040 [Streptomyces sp. ADI96-15]
MFPVTAARNASVRYVSNAPSWWEIPALQKIAAGRALAYSSAISMIVVSGTPVTPEAHAGV